MKVWVRSQDGKKAVCLPIFELAKKNIVGRYDSQGFNIALGKYDSVERAEMVFDELCEFIDDRNSGIFVFPPK